MKNVTIKSTDQKKGAVHNSVLTGKNSKSKNEINTVYLFPESNPNPVIGMDLDFNIHYINPAAKACLKDIQKQGIDHPFLKNIKQIFIDLKNKKEAVNREIQIDDIWFLQAFSFIKSIKLVNIYAFDFTGYKPGRKGGNKLSKPLYEISIMDFALTVRSRDNQ